MAGKKQVAEALLEKYGTTFAEELNIDVEKNSPSALFRLLCASQLFSARIQFAIAIQAHRALMEQGWTTPQKMADTTWKERTRVLNQSGYARYDESTSRMLGDTTELLNSRYKGDLRNLRQEADSTPERERVLLKEFKGIGDAGVDIFFREVQGAWKELFPFADDLALESAGKLGLPQNAEDLLRLVNKKKYVNLVAALVRIRLNKAWDEVREHAEPE